MIPLNKYSRYLAFLVLTVFFLTLVILVKGNQIFKANVSPFSIFRKQLPPPALYPVNKNQYQLPALTAKSVIAVDEGSSVILYQKEPDLRLSPASTTKMMSGLVAVENYRLEEILTVGKIWVEGNKMQLVPGEQIKVEDLLLGLLVGSANDAAQVLAENFPGGMPGFVWAMNQKALEMKLDNTHFTNSVGLDEEGHFSSAKDLARLALSVIKNPIIGPMVALSEKEISDVSQTIKHSLKNTNELVGKIEGVKGVKTGWTESAGECLVVLVERNGHQIITVVLGSQSRFEETEILIDWVFKNFDWQVIAPSNYP